MGKEAEPAWIRAGFKPGSISQTTLSAFVPFIPPHTPWMELVEFVELVELVERNVTRNGSHLNQAWISLTVSQFETGVNLIRKRV